MIAQRSVQITHRNIQPPRGFVRPEQFVPAGMLRSRAPGCRMLPALVQIAEYLANPFKRATNAVEGFLVRLLR